MKSTMNPIGSNETYLERNRSIDCSDSSCALGSEVTFAESGE